MNQHHPVERLIQHAQAKFLHLKQRQSRSYGAAYNEYHRRYKLQPPPGFEGWYKFALARGAVIIDDFDTIFTGISPFLALSGKEVTRIMSDAFRHPGSELWLCRFSLGHTECEHSYRKYDRHISAMFNELLRGLDINVPVSFLVNHLDEPRVLPQLSTADSHSFQDLSHSSRTWKELTRGCVNMNDTLRSTSNGNTSNVLDTFGLPFVQDSSVMDLCKHPEYRDMHGLFLSPTSMSLIRGVPILSTGTLSIMADILIPSPAYTESEFQYVQETDVDWDKKRNKLVWTGSNTGGYAKDETWSSFHRQRFVELAQNKRQREYDYLRVGKNGLVERAKSTFLNSRLYNVAFSRIFQCKRRYCRDQRTYFTIKPWSDKDEALRYRLAFDLDGNGISGRFYKLLASKTLPLKQTLLREWHSERLIPWLHYVPVSLGLEELPELVAYLTSTETGRQRAEEMANQGRDWFFKALRREDMSIHLYRLLLELARLQDPAREAMA
ncbi:glycosyltransferase family 90 protein [Ophiocordyceps camponoti-floridani]|uniref:Glycosyltransferase family 90 protein n=1 Tax=Ophiocordyceps camponoti-floridani TaxID=2030778 RepID=A0A8H4QCV1_9HYPO|nr:glycosyltransferase family 90 protein [Ophiocordyceps camponoti-floridani]